MSSPQPMTSMGLVARLFWMLVGPAILLLVGYSLTDHDEGWLSPRSIAFLIVLAAVIGARWMDPQTSDGELATPSHLRAYTATVLGIGLAAWAIANALGNHWLAS